MSLHVLYLRHSFSCLTTCIYQNQKQCSLPPRPGQQGRDSVSGSIRPETWRWCCLRSPQGDVGSRLTTGCVGWGPGAWRDCPRLDQGGVTRRGGVPVTCARRGCGPRPGRGGRPTAPSGRLRPRRTPSPLLGASSRPLWGSGYALGGGGEHCGRGSPGEEEHGGPARLLHLLTCPRPREGHAGRGSTEQDERRGAPAAQVPGGRRAGRGRPGRLPRTCCSRPRMTCTACCRMSSLVCALSDLRCSWHMRPSSRKASLMSRTRTRSRALLAMRLSRSLRSFSSRDSTSSVLLGHSTGAPLVLGRGRGEGTRWLRVRMPYAWQEAGP